MEDAKYEQKKILIELKSIKHSLNKLINDIGGIGTTLTQKTQFNSF